MDLENAPMATLPAGLGRSSKSQDTAAGGRAALGFPKQDDPEGSSQDGLPSGYVKIAIENGHL